MLLVYLRFQIRNHRCGTCKVNFTSYKLKYRGTEALSLLAMFVKVLYMHMNSDYLPRADFDRCMQPTRIFRKLHLIPANILWNGLTVIG